MQWFTGSMVHTGKEQWAKEEWRVGDCALYYKRPKRSVFPPQLLRAIAEVLQNRNMLPSTISTRVHHQQHGAQNFNASPCTSFRTTMNSRRDPGPSCYSRHNRKCESTKSYLITSNEKKNLQNSHWSMLHSHLCGFIVYFSFIINPYSHVLMYDSVSLTCDSRAMANAKNMN